jgi:regulatory protein
MTMTPPPVDDALRARLQERDLARRTRDAALRLLAVRARSRAELRRRLLRKELPPRLVDACLADLERQALLDDPAFARAVVRERVKRSPRGPVRLRQELRTRGVDETVAGAAIERVLDEEDLTAGSLAVGAALGWLRRQPDTVAQALADPAFSEPRQRARRRLAGHLARRGFTGEAAIAALEAARERAKR